VAPGREAGRPAARLSGAAVTDPAPRAAAPPTRAAEPQAGLSVPWWQRQPWLALLLVALVYYTAIRPVTVLAHELGHAVVPLLATDRPVIVAVGPFRSALRWQLGRLEVRYTPWEPFYGTFRFAGAADGRRLTVPQQAGSLLGGPLASLLVGVVCLRLGRAGFGPPGPGRQLLQLAAAMEIVSFLYTIVPIQYGFGWGELAGSYSDGYQLLRLLTGGR